MSTWAYAKLTKKRSGASTGTSTSTSPPGLSTYIDMVAALVPAEVLAAHATILSFTSKTVPDPSGINVTTITHPETIRLAFYVLLALSIVLYVFSGPPLKKFRDHLRVPIPLLAFVTWTMLQKPSAIDVIWPSLEETTRFAIAVLAAVFLAAAAKALADKADESDPPPTEN